MLILFPLTQQHQQTVTYTCIALETEKKMYKKHWETSSHNYAKCEFKALESFYFNYTIKFNTMDEAANTTFSTQPVL